MTGDLPLSALLSQVLIALTIEVDDEVERRLPHFTSKYGSITPGFGSPWLISSPFWFAVLRHVAPGMISSRDLLVRSGRSPEHALVRWGYALHHADPNDSRAKPPKADWVVIPTANAKRWHETFPIVLADIEQRWRQRHGDDPIDALWALAPDAPTLPQHLPILDHQHRTPVIELDPPEPEAMGLVSVLARLLLQHVYAVEPTLPLSLALSANVVRVAGADDDGALVRELPRRSGVAKQEVTTMVNSLVRTGHALVDGAPKRVRLTDSGSAALEAYERVAAGWDDPALRAALERVPVDHVALHAGGGWRAQVKLVDELPHFPVVTGHGGYPDGA